MSTAFVLADWTYAHCRSVPAGYFAAYAAASAAVNAREKKRKSWNATSGLPVEETQGETRYDGEEQNCIKSPNGISVVMV